MRILSTVLLIVLITALTLGGTLLAVFELSDASDALIIAASISIPVFVVGPALVGSLAGYWDHRSSPDSARYLRWWLSGVVAVDVAGAAVVVLASVSAGAPIWVPVVLIGGAGVLLAVARPLGALFRRTEPPVSEYPADHRFGPAELRHTVAVVTVTFVVSIVVVSIGLVVLAALTGDDRSGLTQAALLAGQLAFTATAFAALLQALPFNGILRASAGGDLGRLRRFAKVVLRGADLPLEPAERLGAVRYATVLPLAMRFQLVYLGLLYTAIAFQMVSTALRGDLGIVPLVALVVMVAVLAWVVPLTLRRIRRATAYAAEHAEHAEHADIDQTRPVPQTIHFHQKHHDAVQRGEKVTTVRWHEDVRIGPAVFVFDEHPTARPLHGAVTEVTDHPLADLTPAAAHQPEGTDMVEFAHQLRANYYPDMPDDAVVRVAVIALDATPPA